jgi:hypothetical protein
MPEQHLNSNERMIACTTGSHGTGIFPQIIACSILFAVGTRIYGYVRGQLKAQIDVRVFICIFIHLYL